MAMIEIELKKASYEFLVLLLSNRASLSCENKQKILTELSRRNDSADSPVTEPH